MRIGVDVRCLMEGHRTGIEEYTEGILGALLKVATEDAFVCFANSRRPMHLPDLGAFDYPDGPSPSRVSVRAFRYPNALFNVLLKVARFPRLDRLLKGVDVFFAPAFRLLPLSPRCPLVLTVHDLSFVRHPEFFSAERRRWHRLMEPRKLARRAAAIIAVSRATAQDLTDLWGIPGTRLTVIPSGLSPVEENISAGLAESFRARYRLPARFLLFVGTLEPRKNLAALLAAYGRVRAAGFPHGLVLAGRTGWAPRAFFSKVRAHSYSADIIVTGPVSLQEKIALYRLADLFVYPSFYEGFGFPPLEALSCGTPVITSVNSAIPEVAGEWTDLVEPGDPTELAEVLLDRLRERRRVSAAVAARVSESYRWERAARATLAVLRSAANQARLKIDPCPGVR